MTPSPVFLSDAQTYRAFGLTLRACLRLDAPPAPAGAIPDVAIEYGPVEEALEALPARRGRFRASPGDWVLSIGEVARYRVRQGRLVTIDRAPGASDADVRLFLLGSALGAVFHQRGDLVLHGSAIVVGDRAAAFLGPSGAGKSTLAAACHARGAAVLTDDLCVMRAGLGGLLEAQPGLPAFKLWDDALERLKVGEAASLPRVGFDLDKRALAVSRFASAARLLTCIYLLQAGDVDRVTLAPLEGGQKFTALAAHTYRLRYVESLGSTGSHFQSIVALAGQTRVVVVTRPRGAYELDALTDAVSADLQRAPAAVTRRTA